MRAFPQFDGIRQYHYVPTRSKYTRGDHTLCERLERAGIDVSLDDARILRRAELTLHRWHLIVVHLLIWQLLFLTNQQIQLQ